MRSDEGRLIKGGGAEGIGLVGVGGWQGLGGLGLVLLAGWRRGGLPGAGSLSEGVVAGGCGCGGSFSGAARFLLGELQSGLRVGQFLRLGFRALAVGVGAVHEMTEQQTEQQLHSGGDENELQPREGAVVAEHVQKHAGSGGDQ